MDCRRSDWIHSILWLEYVFYILNKQQKIGDKLLMLYHIGTALFGTYILLYEVINLAFECNIPI